MATLVSAELAAVPAAELAEARLTHALRTRQSVLSAAVISSCSAAHFVAASAELPASCPVLGKGLLREQEQLREQPQLQLAPA